MANRYWVGGSATWDGTAGTKWATTSGGASGAAVPTAADDVFLDAASGANTVTILATTGVVCRSLNCTGFTGTLTHPTATTVSIGDATAGAGNVALKLNGTMTYSKGGSATSAFTFASTSTTQQTIDSGGKTLGNLNLSGVAGSWTFSATSTIDPTATVNHTAGTLDTGGFNHSWGQYTSSGSGVARTLTMGASTMTITRTSGTVWSVANTPYTLNSGTSTISVTGPTAAWTFSGGGLTYYDLTTSLNQNITISNADTFHNFTVVVPAGGLPNVAFSANPTMTGTLTLTGQNSGTAAGRIYLASGVPGIGGVRTITAAAVSLQNVDIGGVNAQGASIPWTGTMLGNVGGNSNITFAASRTIYSIGAPNANGALFSHWSYTSGGSAISVTNPTDNQTPLPQDDIIYDNNSVTTTGLSLSLSFFRWLCRNLTISTTNNPVIGIGTFNPGITGNLYLAAGCTWPSTAATFAVCGTGTQTITTNGVSIGVGLQITSADTLGTATYTLQDALTLDSARQITVSFGQFITNNFNVSAGLLSSSSAANRTINLGTSTVNLTGVGTVWNMSAFSNLTLSAASATVNITDTSSSTKLIEHRSSSKIGTFNIAGGGTGSVTLGNGTGLTSGYGTLTINAPKSIISGTGGTIAADTFNANGSAGNLITIASSIAGTQCKFSKSSGVVSCDYLSLQDVQATGGASWYAGNNSTNVSGNTGWFFTPPVSGGVMAFFR